MLLAASLARATSAPRGPATCTRDQIVGVHRLPGVPGDAAATPSRSRSVPLLCTLRRPRQTLRSGEWRAGRVPRASAPDREGGHRLAVGRCTARTWPPGERSGPLVRLALGIPDGLQDECRCPPSSRHGTRGRRTPDRCRSSATPTDAPQSGPSARPLLGELPHVGDVARGLDDQRDAEGPDAVLDDPPPRRRSRRRAARSAHGRDRRRDGRSSVMARSFLEPTLPAKVIEHRAGDAIMISHRIGSSS